jgi:hypothetical protein
MKSDTKQIPLHYWATHDGCENVSPFETQAGKKKRGSFLDNRNSKHVQVFRNLIRYVNLFKQVF